MASCTAATLPLVLSCTHAILIFCSAGDAACVAPSSTLQLVSVPTESMLVHVDSVPYLGAKGATEDDIATCLTAHGIKSKGIKNGAVRICGMDVKLVDLYSAIATHGGPAEVRSHE